MIVGKDREETIRLTAEALGVPEIVAAEIVAHELDDPAGDDVVLLDDLDDDDEGPQDDTTPDRQPEG